MNSTIRFLKKQNGFHNPFLKKKGNGLHNPFPKKNQTDFTIRF